MADKSRNFRSTYYDKVGFRGTEEKKALQTLINEHPMDKDKISKFCSRFSLPPMYREYVWKVLLGIVPIYIEKHESIMRIRSLHYQDLEDSLMVMHKITEDAPKPLVHTLMYLITFDVLEFEMEKQMSSPEVKNLLALATFFMKLGSSPVVGFWLFRNFMLHQRKLNLSHKTMLENVEAILKKEDELIYDHLKSTNALEKLPCVSWFEKYFAEILHQNSVERICDKIIAGSWKFLPYVVVSMLTVRKNTLLSMSNIDEMVDYLEKNSEETSDVIVNKAMDMFYS